MNSLEVNTSEGVILGLRYLGYYLGLSCVFSSGHNQFSLANLEHDSVTGVMDTKSSYLDDLDIMTET